MYNSIQIKTYIRIKISYFMADTRLLVVLFPLLAAASWALFNIGRVALQQLKRMS
jgi:hypothetical protein